MTMGNMGFLAGVVLSRLPELLTLIAGLVLFGVSRRRLGGRATGLGVAGTIVLVAGMVIGVAWSILIPRVFDATDLSASEFSGLAGAVGVGLGLLQALGLGLLIAAAFSGRPASAAPAPPPPGLPHPQ